MVTDFNVSENKEDIIETKNNVQYQQPQKIKRIILIKICPQLT